VTRFEHPLSVPLPAAFEKIRNVAYQPSSGSLPLGSHPFLVDVSGVLHNEPGCASGLTATTDAPSVAQWLGTVPAICFCVYTPGVVSYAREVLRVYQQLPSLPQFEQLNAQNIGSWASMTMTARRQLEKLSPLPASAPKGSGVLGKAVLEVVAEVNDTVQSLRDRLKASLETDAVRSALTDRSSDKVVLIAALDEYQPHDEETASVDGDLADVCAAAFTYARAANRIAIRAPRGLVNFLAIYRRSGGFVEAANDPSLDPKVVETALVLWEPDSGSAYGQWRNAIAAALKLI